MDRLYLAPLEARTAAAEDGVELPAPDEARIKAVHDASRALTASTASLLEDDDRDVRAVGVVRLAALAARDFAVAADVARLEPEGDVTAASYEVSGAALPLVEREVAFVLRGDPADGVPVSDSGWTDLPTLASMADVDSRRALGDALEHAIDTVRDDAAEVVADGVHRMLGSAIGDALGHLIAGALANLPAHPRRWWRWAVNIFKQGIDKLTRLFGDAFNQAVDKIRTWFEQYAAEHVLDRAYDTDGLKRELRDLADRADADRDFDAVSESVARLVGRHATQKTVMLALFTGLSFCRPIITALVAAPVGGYIVSAVFGLGAAYAVYSGGDYVDWRRTRDDGFFDFVHGIRQTAEQGLG